MQIWSLIRTILTWLIVTPRSGRTDPDGTHYNGRGQRIGRTRGDEHFDAKGRYLGRTQGQTIVNAQFQRIAQRTGDRYYDRDWQLIGRYVGTGLVDRTGQPTNLFHIVGWDPTIPPAAGDAAPPRAKPEEPV